MSDFEKKVKKLKKTVDKMPSVEYTIIVAGRYGSLAQLGEHLPYKQRVTGSSPVGPICRRGGTGRRAGLKILL